MSATVDSAPLDVALRCYRGDDFGFVIVVWDGEDPADLTGATVLAQLRATPDATDVLTTFGYTITGNEITLTLTAEDVDAVPARSRWDCQITFGDGSVRTIAYGAVVVVADVSRSTVVAA